MPVRDDPEKQREWWNRWYQKNKAKKIAWQEKRRADLRRWFSEYKSKLKCSRCPEDHPACLQFHHKDPRKKEVMVSNAISKNWSVRRILGEIKKCEVLCANCHAKEHYNGV